MPFDSEHSSVHDDATCACHENEVRLESVRFIGTDSGWSDISLQSCPRCGQLWLHLADEESAFSGSGLWYLMPLSQQDAEAVTAEDARARFEAAPEYWAGGSYFNSTGFKRSGRLSFPI